MWAVKRTSGGMPLGGRGICDIMAVDPLPAVLENMPGVFPGSGRKKSECGEGGEHCDAEVGSVSTVGSSEEDIASATRIPEVTRREDLSAHVGGQQAFLIHNILTHAESNAIVELSELCGFSEAAPDISTPPGMRMNLSSHWVSPSRWMNKVFERIKGELPQEIDGKKLLGLSCRLNMYKYLENMHFKPHVDGDWPAYAVDEDDKSRIVTLDSKKYGHSKMSMLLYLNDSSDATAIDGVQGGSTRLYLSQRGGKSYEVAPRKGSALFFRHGFGQNSVLHEGCPVRGAKPKYVARINVMYECDDDM